MTVVLGIETSCDETSVALLEGRGDEVTLRSLVILSQDVHRLFGGVVPELASRAHLTAIEPVLRGALSEAKAQLHDIDVVAVTIGPGLVGALLVGVSFGKALAAALEKPVVGVHHMEGHLFATSLEHRDAIPPFTALLVSGGHTLIVDAEAWGRYRMLGRTRDDAAGEAFDKVAKLLGLPYPGGPHLERLAAGATRGRVRFARPMLRRDQAPGDADFYDLSFSGLKTAALNEVRRAEPAPAAEIAAAFQDSLVETLVEKTARAVQQHGRTRVVLGGGVAGNGALVDAMRARMAMLGASVYAPSGRLATDNAAMIARAGLFHFERGFRSGPDLNAYASLTLPGLLA
ncbi:MAG TPA: tRNA (adenosine(37)-N6)-threonylcarbamoyltransferase complex transferase subunit TsaD [Gemmatimonadaceae bacterium]|nr:tRNA (adenosine(37)-N6)-threonylcarbamoyltransferase complex transferase subunit TsaD [Gemmatimonadaceae bacterium]